MNRQNASALETCAQPQWEGTQAGAEGAEGEGIGSDGSHHPAEVPETQEDQASQDLQGVDGVDSLSSTSPLANGFLDDFPYDEMNQVERAQTVLVAMQAQCPTSRYCARVSEEIEALVIEATLLWTINPEDTADTQALKNRIKEFMDKFKEIKGFFDDMMGETKRRKSLRRHATDETTDNDDDMSPTTT